MIYYKIYFVKEYLEFIYRSILIFLFKLLNASSKIQYQKSKIDSLTIFNKDYFKKPELTPIQKYIENQIIYEEGDTVQKIITEVRRLKAQFEINEYCDLYIEAVYPEGYIKWKNILEKMAEVKPKFLLENMTNTIPFKVNSHLLIGDMYYLKLPSSVDIEQEKERLERKLKKLEKLKTKNEDKLANNNFLSKAPKEIVDKERQKLENTKNEIQQINKILENLNK